MASPAIASPPTLPIMSFGVEQFEEQEQDYSKAEQKRRLRDWLRRLPRGSSQQSTPNNVEARKPDTPPQTPLTPQRPGLGRRLSKKVGVGLPRSTTFKRQQDESRHNLEPVAPTHLERRQRSIARLRALSASPKKKSHIVRRETSAPDLTYQIERFPSIDARILRQDFISPSGTDGDSIPPPPPPPPRRELPPAADEDAYSERSYESAQTLEDEIRLELERKWILNLSMHFRDKSPREKFFITYAETPQKWRRVTVSCDYRHIEPESLEADLQDTTSQREKSARIYESLRGSLGDIQFYETVTNLKLETQDERLHVHVTEDVNEIIAYPPIKTVQHLHRVKRFKEQELEFMEHMSGFVYKVKVNGKVWVKKEIPGPESVDEFLYEVNALSNLTDASHVIELQGLVVNEDESQVKGLLIAYAEKNALVDIIYDHQGDIPWARRECWSRQIVAGLKEIHEAGFVQGDFTLSNIVINGNDEAQIIDINRRGCPIGWEPPEIESLIASGQRIAMFIGIKSDIFQLGMVLWALAMENDEPDRQARPLILDHAPEEIPGYFRGLVERCLNKDPVARGSAKELLMEFPASVARNDPSLENLPKIRPAPVSSSVPVVNGDPATHFYVPEPQVPSEQSHDRIQSVHNEGAAKNRGGNRLLESPGTRDRSLGYTDLLSNNNNHSLLPTPRNHDEGSSVAAQPSSTFQPEPPSQDVSNANFHPSPPRTPPKPPRFPPPHRRNDSMSSLPDQQEHQYHDAHETIALDTSPTTDYGWSATLNDPASPYEVDPEVLSPLDEPLSRISTTLPPQPATEGPSVHSRRTHNTSRETSGSIPSPPPHVDSGLADVDDSPRASLEQARQRLSLHRDRPLHPLHEHDDAGGGDGGEFSHPPLHTDSGLDDLTSNVGLAEGLSFKARMSRDSGGLKIGGKEVDGLGEELQGMIGLGEADGGKSPHG